jgi:hypothetical protein
LGEMEILDGEMEILGVRWIFWCVRWRYWGEMEKLGWDGDIGVRCRYWARWRY